MISVGGNQQNAGAAACGGHNNAASAQFEDDDGWVQLTHAGWKRVTDGMAASIVRIQQELEEAQAQIAVYEAERSILQKRIAELEADTPETDAATIHAMGQLRTAVVDLEFARKLERERDQLREKNKTLAQCWREAEQERDHFRMQLEARK